MTDTHARPHATAHYRPEPKPKLNSTQLTDLLTLFEIERRKQREEHNNDWRTLTLHIQTAKQSLIEIKKNDYRLEIDYSDNYKPTLIINSQYPTIKLTLTQHNLTAYTQTATDELIIIVKSL